MNIRVSITTIEKITATTHTPEVTVPTTMRRFRLSSSTIRYLAVVLSNQCVAFMRNVLFWKAASNWDIHLANNPGGSGMGSPAVTSCSLVAH